MGYTSSKAFDNLKDYSSVIKKAKDNKKGFELLSAIKMPREFNSPVKKTSTLNEIWNGKEINKVREKHLKNKGQEINICKNCSFKDVYEWLD